MICTREVLNFHENYYSNERIKFNKKTNWRLCDSTKIPSLTINLFELTDNEINDGDKEVDKNAKVIFLTAYLERKGEMCYQSW